MKRSLILAFTILLATFLSPVVAHDNHEVPEISIENLESLLGHEDLILLDLNGSKYFAKGHIPGALDFRAHEKHLAKTLGEDKGKTVVVYCGAADCHAYLTGAEAAHKLGFTKIFRFAPGISGWIEAGKPTGPEAKP